MKSDPFAVLFACIYCAVVGALVGRMMLRSEQARDRRMSQLEEDVWQLKHPKPDVMTESKEQVAAAPA